MKLSKRHKALILWSGEFTMAVIKLVAFIACFAIFKYGLIPILFTH